MKYLLIIFACILTINVEAQSVYFPPLTGNTWDTTSPLHFNWCQNRIDSLYDLLERNNTKGFILLKDGKIVLEQYFNGHSQSSNWYWASAGKTLTAFMVGIAQQENHLSINDPTSVYLGQGWTNTTSAQEIKITIKDQLSMTTGLDDGVDDVHCTLDTCLIYKADAGARWAYHNAPYTLLDGVIEGATGMTLNNYTTQKLKLRTGITGSYLTVDFNNVFFSTTRSMARFGLLILNKGNWNGDQIMTDSTYFDQMTHTSQVMNPSYGYLWWLNGATSFVLPQSQLQFSGPINPNAPADMIAALGKNGQFINVVPSQNLVWVRMGEAPDGLEVPFLLNDQIWQYINELECAPTGIVEEKTSNSYLMIFPVPVKDLLHIESDKEIEYIEILNLQGQLIRSFDIKGPSHEISTGSFKTGIYLINISFTNGETSIRKFIKVE